AALLARPPPHAREDDGSGLTKLSPSTASISRHDELHNHDESRAFLNSPWHLRVCRQRAITTLETSNIEP
ncbi:MAG: hypothetical protein PHH46_05500, partial [Firmicutes bacterium]|nr:hypothetical protein [Bacillota bacterium]